MNWESYKINLGEIKEGNKVKFSVKALRPLEISRILSGCGCTKVKYKEGQIEGIYKAKSVPMYRRQDGFYISSVPIKILYEDGSEDSLYVRSKIII